MVIMLKKILKKFFNFTGYEISRISDGKPANLHSKAGDNCNESFKIQRDLLNEIEKSGIVIFDVGANVGNTIQKYMDLFPQSKIYGFEAYPEVSKKLTTRFNNKTNVTIVQKAVGKEKKQSEFYVNNLKATNSVFPREIRNKRYYPRNGITEKVVCVDVIDLDGYCFENNIGHIDILKMDIQGGELEALKGASLLIKDQAIDLIYTESFYFPHYAGAPYFHDIAMFLYNYGYKVYGIYNHSKGRDGQLRQSDFIYISDKFRKKSQIFNVEEP
jgi:FkbM family methyltransferase